MQIDTEEEICVYRDWVIRERGECQGEFSPKKKKKTQVIQCKNFSVTGSVLPHH